jgi:hypothetical protein
MLSLSLFLPKFKHFVMICLLHIEEASLHILCDHKKQHDAKGSVKEKSESALK